MKEFVYTIKDPTGFHARPAGLFVKEASEFKSSISISKQNVSANAKKLLDIMDLGIRQGEKITLRASGEDEEKAIHVLGEFFEKNM